MLLLLNLKTVHRVSNVCMDELFSLLKTKVLTKGNKMPATTYKALELIKGFGLNSLQFTHALMVVCFFEALRKIQECVHIAMLIGMWMNHNVFHRKCFNISF